MKEKPLIVRPFPANTAKTGSTITTYGKNEHNDDNIIMQQSESHFHRAATIIYHQSNFHFHAFIEPETVKLTNCHIK